MVRAIFKLIDIGSEQRHFAAGIEHFQHKTKQYDRDD
jgi:hypothetical protein